MAFFKVVCLLGFSLFVFCCFVSWLVCLFELVYFVGFFWKT